MFVVSLRRPPLLKITLFAVLVALLAWASFQDDMVDEAYPSVPAAAKPWGNAAPPIYMIDTKEKKVTLTFDISWGSVRPGPVLDVLKKYDVKATFFLSGPWAQRHPEIVRRIQAEGHEIQSHGHKHVNYHELSAEQVKDNIRSAHRILAEITGGEPNMVRPPNGSFNQASLQAAREAGYETIIWSVDSLDWKNPGVDVITQRVLKRIHPGAIVLLHASDTCKQTDQALPAIIEGLRAQGYEMVLLKDLMKLGKPIVPTLAPVAD